MHFIMLVVQQIHKMPKKKILSDALECNTIQADAVPDMPIQKATH